MALVLLACAVIASVIGSQKGGAIGGFILGLLFGPIGILAALVVRRNRGECAADSYVEGHSAAAAASGFTRRGEFGAPRS